MENDVQLADGVAANMGDGVFVHCQRDQRGRPQNVVLTRADLGAHAWGRQFVSGEEDPDPVFASIERVLKVLGKPRTRENFLRASFEQLPDEWDDEAEELNLPADLRIIPAPPTPLLQ